MRESRALESRTDLAERVISLIESELAAPLEQRPDRMSDGALTNLRSLVLSVERALNGDDAGTARQPIELLGHFATDGLDYESVLAAALAEYLQVADPEH